MSDTHETEKSPMFNHMHIDNLKYRVLDNLIEGCQIIDYDFCYLYVNDAVAVHGRTTKDALIGRNMVEMYPGIEHTEMFKVLKQCMTERCALQMENEFTFTDGSIGWFNLKFNPIPEGVFILSLDITERKQADEHIAHLNSLLHGIRNVNQLITRQRNPKLLIQKACELMVESGSFNTCCIVLCHENNILSDAYAGESRMVKALELLMAKGDLPDCLKSAIHEASAVVRSDLSEQCNICPVNSNYTYRRNTIAVRIENDGRTIGALLASLPPGLTAHKEDIDLLQEVSTDLAFALRSIEIQLERDKSSEQLRDTFEKLDTIVRTSPAAIFSFDTQGQVLTWNKGAESLFGLPADEVLHMPLLNVCRNKGEEHASLIRHILAGKTLSEQEIECSRKDGSTVWISMSTAALRDVAGAATGAMAVALDITQHKSADRERSLTVSFLQLINDSRNITELLSRTVRFFKEELEFETAELFLQKEDRLPTDKDYSDDNSKQKTVFSLRVSEQEVWALQLENSKQNCFAPEMVRLYEQLAAHLTAALSKMRSEENLSRSEARYRELVANLDDVVYSTDTHGIILFMSPAVKRIFGYTETEVIGRHFADFVHPEDVPVLLENFKRVLSGISESYEFRVLNKKGEVHQVRSKNRLRINSGAVKGVDGIVTDITEQRRAEEQMKALQRLEAIGRLAGGVAHDFNNMLSVIINYADFALEALPEHNSIAEYILQIKKAGNRAEQLTRQLLAFSRKQMLEPKVINLKRTLADVESMLRRLLGEDIRILVHSEDNLGNITADPGQIEQVIMNLAVNARDAMPGGGKLIIEMSNVDLTDAYSNAHISVKPGKYVLLSVTDTGYGMNSEIKEHIFEPFFTTKEKGKGTGLGLATVYGIVKQSNGNIWVYSEPGHGTTFKIYLPRADAIETERQSKPASVKTDEGETIFIVEDEEAVRKVTEHILRTAGYHVLSANGGKEALALADLILATNEIALLLTDVVMPEMSGKELSVHLTERIPKLKTLYMSGYTDNAIVHHGVLDPGVQFISKPFTASDLTRKVREILNG